MLRFPPLHTILLDLDGTLVDSKDLIVASWRHTMAVHFGHVPPDEVWLRTMGQPLKVQFREYVDTREEVQPLVDTYVEHNLREHGRYIRRFPGVRETIGQLRQRGLRVGIVTSKATPGTKASLAACDLDESMFDVIITSDEPVPHKPDPAPILLALDRLGVAPDTATYVGDSVWDIRAGRAAGVFTVAALWGPFSEALLAAENPDAFLSAFGDLPEALGPVDD